MADITITRLLYMEDDPGLSVLLQKNLQRRGFQVDVAANGEEGLKLVEAGRYDLLLIDYNMPFLGGIDVMRAIASRGLVVPIIMVTGEGNETVAVEALKLGAADYIVKDVEMRYLELLPAVIDKVLYKQQLIKERNQMQEAMRESEERYRLLVELSPDGIAVHSDGKFVFINPSGARMLGAESPDQLIGMTVLDLVHEEFREVAKSRIRQLGGRMQAVPWIEEKFLKLDGMVIDVEVASVNFTYEGKPAVQTIFRDITERKLVEQKLKQMALYDTLTGLPNRTLFFDRMTQLLELAKRNKYVIALLYVDLDRFKTINDTLGHEVGDLVLATAGQRMVSCTRRSDTVARIGGDEFIGICGRITAPADAAVVAQKMIVSLSEPFRLRGHECAIGASVGISIYPQDGDDVETLVSKADSAMYRVKESGKGGFQFYSTVEGDPTPPKR
jgi:diguanylate cyclase (GGDEF)-like protein/PAS domain S-box-containing protein